MRLPGLTALLIGAWASASPAVARPPADPPRGAVIGRDGFATIRTVPNSSTADVRARAPSLGSPEAYYARDNGLSIDEARRRLGEQWALRPVFERLEERLRRLEPDNYISARVNHHPDWHYVLFFKRDPQATLRRYSVNPRFKAASAKFSLAEAQALASVWGQRFARAGVGGAMMFPFEDRVEMSLAVTQRQFRAAAERERWVLPPQLRLSFAQELDVPRVDPRVASYLRGFASESVATQMQMEMGASGRVVLDNGCLRLAVKGKAKGPLVVFHQETGIGLDQAGYLAAIDRRTGKAVGRVGEVWSWAAPNPGTKFDGLEDLKSACGDGPIENVGNPESEAVFDARQRARR